MSKQSDDIVVLEAVINELREVERRVNRFDEVKYYRVYTARSCVAIAIAEMQAARDQRAKP